MKHIELAISVLRSEIFNLKKEIENGHYLPQQEDEVMQDIQKLNRAIREIQDHFYS